jgi:uncharacterized protein involved in outer membrane biogenesis
MPAPNVYAFKGLNATWAGNDLHGNAQIDLAGRRPMVSAGLYSRKLDIRPFLGDHGQPPRENRPAPSGTKKDKVFSNDPLPFDRLGRIDADMRLRVRQILLPRITAEHALLNLELKDGRLDVPQVRFQVGPGQAEGRFTVRSRENKADLNLEMAVEDLDMGAMFGALKQPRIVEGPVDANVKVSSSGGSVAELMAGLDGRADLVMSNGRVSMKYLDLIDIDVVRRLFQLINPLKKDTQYTAINCLVERMDIEKGLVQHKLFLDTEQTTLVSAGQVNLKTEGLSISIKSSPKQQGLGIPGVAHLSIGFNELARPFKLGGTLSKPILAIDATQTTLAIGKALGGIALFGPLGVLTALGDVSIGKKDSCLKAMKSVEKEAEQSLDDQNIPEQKTKPK